MRSRLCCWMMVWMMGVLAAQGEVKPALQKLPEGFRGLARAESLDALVRQTKATLSFDTGDGDKMLL